FSSFSSGDGFALPSTQSQMPSGSYLFFSASPHFASTPSLMSKSAMSPSPFFWFCSPFSPRSAYLPRSQTARCTTLPFTPQPPLQSPFLRSLQSESPPASSASSAATSSSSSTPPDGMTVKPFRPPTLSMI